MYNNTHERGIRHQQAAPSGVTYGQSTASGPAPTTAGHHKHDILNKVDPRIDSTHDHQPMAQPTHNVPEGTYGPHKSRIANALDPRVDSDLDSRRTHDGGMGSQAVHAQVGHHHHNAGVGGIGAGGGMMGTGTMGAGYGAEHNNYGTTAGVGGAAPEGTYGPHTSRLGNAADPRVDSDRDHRHAGAGVGHHSHHQAGMMGGGGVNQPTAAQMAGTGVGAGGPMTAAHTLGPHKSDLMNKLDPRVDSKTGQMKGGAGAGRGTY